MKTKGTLYIISTSLANNPLTHIYNEKYLEVIRRLNHFVVETPKLGRGYLRGLNNDRQVNTLSFYTINENINQSELVIAQLQSGNDVGLMSDAGIPGVADSGSGLVLEAHKLGIKVFPIPVGSSLLLALCASGLNGQHFTFNGYLPKERDLRRKRINELERLSKSTSSSQLFIETPYRAQYMFEDIIASCNDTTLLHISANIEYDSQFSITKTIKEWKREKIDLARKRVVYILQSA